MKLKAPIRKGCRHELVLKVDALSEEARADRSTPPTQLHGEYLTDLSEGGLRLHTVMPLVIGQQLPLSISFPGLLAPLECEAVVRWIQPSPSQDGSLVAGLAFRNLEPAARKQLNALLGELLRPERRAPAGRSFTALLLEPNPTLREFYAQEIRALAEVQRHDRFELETLATPAALDAALERHMPDLLIVDMDCFVRPLDPTLSRILNRKEPPVVLLGTGHTAVQDFESAHTMYLQKPIRFALLMQTISTLARLEPIVHEEEDQTNRDSRTDFAARTMFDAPSLEADVRLHIAPALMQGAATSTIARAAERLEALAQSAVRGDRPARLAHASILYDLQNEDDPWTAVTRQFLAYRLHLIESPAISLVERVQLRSPGELASMFEEDQAAHAGSGHALSHHLFEGSPTLDDVRVHMKHEWRRTKGLRALIPQFVAAHDLGDAELLPQDLYQAGLDNNASAPLGLLRRLIEHLGLCSDGETRPTLHEAHVYLNNAIQCARHPNPAWGAAVILFEEYSTAKLNASLYRLLKRLELPDDCCEFHRLRGSSDPQHGNGMLEATTRLVRTAEDQQAFFSSLHHHRKLQLEYFDAIYAEMSAGRERTASP